VGGVGGYCAVGLARVHETSKKERWVCIKKLFFRIARKRGRATYRKVPGKNRRKRAGKGGAVRLSLIACVGKGSFRRTVAPKL